ncbi:integrase catalytic domain-containing protein [Trichonephila clavipes]|nr:integrase catalytic domain-containing protein [Trichonephila clavipes]
MFKNCRKEDLRILALELGETVAEKVTIVELTEIIKENKYFKEDVEFVKELIQYTIEDRKRAEEDRKKEAETTRGLLATDHVILNHGQVTWTTPELAPPSPNYHTTPTGGIELELARLNVNSDNERTGEGCNTLDALVKSVRILTVKVPNRPEGWAFFFASLERAFVSKNVPEKFKSEILLNLLGEKASNVLTYVKDDELNNYEQLKSIILREYEPSANQFLEQFKKATRHPNETFIQYTSRLITNWQYYLKLRKVSDFDILNDLIVSDKIFSSLEKEVASHISVRAGNDWFRPLELAKEIDLYNTSRGKSLKTLPNVLTRNNPVKNASRVFLSEIKDSKCICCAESHPLYKCAVYLKLPINKRIDLIKTNNLCFNCLSTSHRAKDCKSRFVCSECQKRHHKTIHYTERQPNQEVRNSTFEPLNTSAPVFESRVENHNLLTATNAKGKEHCEFIQAADNLEHSIKKFWEIENVEIDSVKTSELDICEDHFKSTHSRDDQGRYTVAMPLKEDPSCLGESRQTAIQRLNSLWKRLSRDKEYLSLYEKFLQEYEDLGHMREIKADGSGVSFYMPHHGVYRPEKSTTKMRTVFNASSPSTSGKSLNSIQFNGGLVQEDLFSIMVRFRKHKYAFTTDIEKMFRMINIHPEQTCLQRILWKKGIGEPIKTYELTTVTYGTVSAPYLATRTLKQLAMDEANNFPLAAPVLLSDCYMDDILSGSESIEEVIELQHQLIEMFKTAGMELHKWCGNLPEITSNLQEYAFLESEETKALGMIWNPKLDCFLFRIEQQRPTSFTKRMVLSTIARIFDPLGLLGPIITWAKIFMQRLWLLELGWSDELPFKEQKEWRRFIDSLKAVNNISIDRCIVIHRAESIELHAFSDASEKAYGSSIYLKSISALGEVKVCLVTSKSRVSPLKQISIPRLELCGAVLAAKLMKKVKEALNLQITAVHFWSDSTIVISWIHRESRELKTFVANRVSKIHQLSSRDQWHHIASEQNPADVLSRGLLPEELRDDSLWWHGPELLQSTYSATVIAEPTQRDGFDCELRVSERTLETSLLSSKNFDFFNHLMDLSNNYFKIIHIVSYIYRFIENCRSKVKKRGPLTTSEVNDAETWLIKQDQSGINLSDPSGNLKSLNIFQDDKGILRVGGRLEKASIPYSQKHPAILAKNSKLSKIYFITLHKKLFHVGPQGLLNVVRLRFWALGGRNLAKKTVHTCVVCFKCKPIPSSQIMDNLPYERVNMAPPFSITGLDLGGPYFVTYKHQRKGVLNKIYVCVCICFVTRAIHLEILSDLTSDAIIATLKRFMSRRGKCSKIFTDNATNFVGANSQLKVFYKTLNFPDQNLAAYFTEEGIEWNFIPPRAPHMGGLWEAGIKSVKYHLKRALGRSRLTYEEFETVIIQVEGILNSRPLTPISNDFDNFERGKWMIEKDNVMCGTMVIVKEDFTPVCNWLLGRVVEVNHGSDGKVRTVRIKTKNGEFKRPITKICILPVDVNN